MLTPARREQLSKTYELVGSHSAVKLCRWQRAMLRGRGGCYKYTMYGIESHRCMEATPSLGCANKCSFCWRQNANPTIKEWNFVTDPPVQLVGDLVDAHVNLVHGVSGMPDVVPERLDEAYQPAHCALSLVGEPIAYPNISEFVHELHKRRISSFLVNNGQFPEAIRTLAPVTQLYLSIDAANKDDMQRIDRPIFPDFWERFLKSVDYLREKKGRTVFRLTLIKGFNMEDIEGYSQLVRQGEPDFIELKQVTPTFQGNKSTPLRMTNVPAWDEVIAAGRRMCDASDGAYEIACAHQHSRCLLLARVDKFRVNGEWWTWIDFTKFLDMMADDSLDHANITALDFAARTPSWATFGAPERGFDPNQKRHLTAKQRKLQDAGQEVL